MRHLLLATLVLCLVMPAWVDARPQASSQTQATEADLKVRIAQQPDEPSGYLSLAIVYLEQGRFTDAQQMIGNALALTRRLAASQSPATADTPPGPSGPVRIGGDIQAPVKIRDVQPVYPAAAAAANVKGIVIIEALIDKLGNVAEINVLRSIQLLDQAAVDAVSQWQYEPTMLNGQPVEVLMTVTVNFPPRD